jgi:hypothetical protein
MQYDPKQNLCVARPCWIFLTTLEGFLPVAAGKPEKGIV